MNRKDRYPLWAMEDTRRWSVEAVLNSRIEHWKSQDVIKHAEELFNYVTQGRSKIVDIGAEWNL